ncbi:hypothetical protein H312_02573 [Anncaliia algerae PRA339]|uniref:ISXO2-like transposase domain-containing protein n=1 Tax=Anncaliia algerae PRA339 TaxID=1288291 RepID=A0A059EZ79_9MICR|nr:hypothetical protein H312_02573 [Anncaliia algerae PRA339]
MPPVFQINKASTIIPIICSQVPANSIIWTFKHNSYTYLPNFSFIHNTVCQKYEFVNSSSGVNTQPVMSFHNSLKLVIKRKKGGLTNFRDVFIKEFCFYFNNRHNYFHAGLNLIKVNFNSFNVFMYI